MDFESLGIFETSSTSSLLKALEQVHREKSVKIVGKQVCGEGIVTAFVSGNLGAVKRALTAGADAIISSNEFRSMHIIPLPHKNLFSIIRIKKN